jgi:hypothetical protein
VPTGPFENGTAPGIWTLEQQAAYVKQGIWPTAGNVDPSAFIENLFSTYLYTGNGTSQTITNGINLSGRGGMTWIKQRSATRDNLLFDTTRGATQRLFSNLTLAQAADAQSLTAFNSNGFSIGSDSGCNINAGTYVSWTFQEQPKFFDVVTYTGTGSVRTVAHNLGSAPGFMIVKRTNSADEWFCYHRSLGAGSGILLNSTIASFSAPNYFNSTAPTSTVFTLGTDSGLNGNGGTYVAYLFAHDAGGFGLTGTDNVVSCGSFTTDGSGNATVSLGYEPQWVLIKQTDGVDSWYLNDNMRGMAVSGNQPNLSPNSSAAESAGGYNTYPNATGFTASVGIASKAYIYIAIRRGPMRVPTTGTSVFAPVISTNNLPAWTSGFPVDMGILGSRAGSDKMYNAARLMGDTSQLKTNTTDAAANFLGNQRFDQMSGYGVASTWGTGYIGWMMRRAPGFFDVVCYAGTGADRSITHNLGVSPQIAIIKKRNAVMDWSGGYNINADGSSYARMALNTNSPDGGYNSAIISAVSSTTFSVGTSTQVNLSGDTYVAYLFATCPGVSKVGSYTGTGTTQTINCGFTGGARFVLIKRTDSTGDWYVWDTARGMIPANDPYLLINSTAAEVTGTDFVDTTAVGFEITSTAPAAINASGGTFIFLAIA